MDDHHNKSDPGQVRSRRKGDTECTKLFS